MASSASRECRSVYAATRPGAIQRRKARSTALPPSLSTSPQDDACRCSAPPPRAARRSNRPLCGSADKLWPRTPSCVLPAGVQVGGEGGARRGAIIIAIFGSILGVALHPLFTPAARNRPLDPAAAWRNCLCASSNDLLCRCGCSQGKGRRQRQRAGPSCTRLGVRRTTTRRTRRRQETVLISTI